MASSSGIGIDFDVHYDGTFVQEPLRYINGVVRSIHLKMGVSLEEMMECLKIQTETVRLYGLYFCLLDMELENGLCKIKSEKNFAQLFDLVATYDKVELYLDHFGVDNILGNRPMDSEADKQQEEESEIVDVNSTAISVYRVYRKNQYTNESGAHTGWKYNPTDADLIEHLKRIIQNLPVKCNIVKEVDLYSNYPWVVLGDI